MHGQRRRRRGHLQRRLGAAALDGPGLSDRAVLPRDHDQARAVSRLRRAAGQQHAVRAEHDTSAAAAAAAAAAATPSPPYDAGGGEPGYIAPDPKDPDVFFAGANNGSFLTRLNRRTGELQEVGAYPRFFSGENSAQVVERWQWTYPIIFSPVDPNVLYTSSQHVWKTTNGGQTWDRDQRRPHPPRSEDDAGFGRADHARHEQPRDLRDGVLAGARQDRRQYHLGGIGRRHRPADARRREDLDQRHAEGHAGLRPRQPDRRVDRSTPARRTSR